MRASFKKLIAARKRLWREKNPQKAREYTRRWREKNRESEKVREYHRRGLEAFPVLCHKVFMCFF